MKKIFNKIKRIAKRFLVFVKKIAKKAVKAIEDGAQWCVDHPEAVMIVSAATEIGFWTVKKIRKSSTQREIDYQRKHIYDYSIGHHWTLRRELTSNEMMELSRRKENGEALGDILESMRVLV